MNNLVGRRHRFSSLYDAELAKGEIQIRSREAS